MKTNREKKNTIKVFGMSNQIIAEELTRIEKFYDIELGHTMALTEQEEQQYYSQFDRSVRREASAMARHYEIFYCLEKSIRELITDTMDAVDGAAWWEKGRVPPAIHAEVAKRIKREIDTGMTLRSLESLDFKTFGELSGIIFSNWDLFGGILTSQKAVEKIMSQLNSLRGPIAHCNPLAEDEVLRLQITLRDWFRQME
jgi:hypothetical protein